MNTREGDAVSLSIVGMFMRAVDAVIVVVSAYVVFDFYLGDNPEIPAKDYVLVTGLGIFLQQNVFHFAGVYRPRFMLSFNGQIKRVVLGWALVLCVLVLTAFLAKASSEFSRIWTLGWFGLAAGILVGSRIVLGNYVRQWVAAGRLTQNVVVVGGGVNGQDILGYLGSSTKYMKILGFFDDRGNRVPADIDGIERLGPTASLVDFARSHRVDLILIALPWKAERRIMEIVRLLRELPVDIRLTPETSRGQIMRGGYSDLYGVPVLNLMDKPLDDWQRFTKTMEDYTLGILGLILFLPLLAIVAAAVKLQSPGPVFFRQRRYGYNHQLIEVYKFRTMYADQTDQRADRLASPGDPRITAIGRFLRKTSIDELPQIFNVLKGEMSIVGPRPHALGAKAADQLYYEVVEEYAIRHRIKPGITGWAQVNGWRGNTDTEEKIRKRVECDLHYIDNWSLWFDIKIIVLTVFEVARSRNAH